jgi:manganese transport protein
MGRAGEDPVGRAARAALEGRRRGLGRVWPFLGPAFVAAVAYVDPGNFATDMEGGARYGYLLLWVVACANLVAVLVQSMSARLGIATGRNLAELCREAFPWPMVALLWLQAEVVAMATDLAEFVGAALALRLLFGLALLPAALLTGAAVFGLLALQRRGVRPLEAAVSAMVGVIVLAFALQVFFSGPEWGRVFFGLLEPRFAGSGSVLLAAGILGATVMPHAIYLHSALVQRRVVGRTAEERRRIYRFELLDVAVAMGLAGLVNASMLVVAAALFHPGGAAGLDEVFYGISALEGRWAAVLFGLALLASGLSSSSVGTMSGQVVMQGFISRSIPLFARRALTMAPALAVIAAGVDPAQALVLSQVVLSFGIPFALIPLILFCRDRALMGSLAVGRPLTTAVAAAAAAVISLNALLLYQTLRL